MPLHLAATGLFIAAAAACAPAKVAPPQLPEPTTPIAEADVELPPRAQLDDTTVDDEPRVRPDAAPVIDRDGAFAAVRSGNPEGAIGFLGKHVAANASDTQARLELARAFAGIGQIEEALHVLESAAGSVDSPEIWRQRARLQHRRGNVGNAKATTRLGLRQHGADIGLQGQLLELLVASGERDAPEAVALREGLYDDFDAGEAQSAIGLWAVAQATLARGTGGGFHDANMVLGDAEALAPASEGSAIGDEIVLLHASIFLEKYATGEAAETLALILERDPWHPNALASLGKVAVTSMQLASAARYAQEALLVDARQADAHAVLAQIELVEGRKAEAVQRIRDHVLVQNPTHTDGLAVLAAAAIAADDAKGYATTRDTALDARPDNGRFYTRGVEMLNVLHLYPEALALAREGVDRLPNDPYVQSSFAITALQLGDEATGRAALDAAWQRDRFNERTFNMRKLYRERIETHYVDVDLPEVSLRLPKSQHELLVPHVRAAVTRTKAALDARYGIDTGKLRVEIFESPDDFAIRTVGVPNLGALGVCFGPVITLMGPHQGVHNFQQVVWHELAHTYAITLSRGRVPRWFTEGLSEWESFVADAAWARENAPLMRKARRDGRLRSLAQLELAFLRAPSPMAMELAYTQSAYALRFLGETYGHPAIVATLRGYGEGHGTSELFATVFGQTIPDLDRAFLVWLDATLGDPGWQPDPRTAKQRGDIERHETYARALALLEAQKIAAARKQVQKLVQSGDGFAVRMLAAQIEMSENQLDDARKHLTAARRFDALAPEPWLLGARIEALADDVAAEKRALAAWLQIDAMSFVPAARLLTLAALTDDDPAFLRALDRTIAIAPLNSQTLAALALREVKNPTHARALLKAAQQAPGEPSSEESGRAADRAAGQSSSYSALAALAYAGLKDAAQAKRHARAALAGDTLPTSTRPRLRQLAGLP